MRSCRVAASCDEPHARHLLRVRDDLRGVPAIDGLPAAGASRQISFVQVVQKEFALTLSRPAVQRGTDSVELIDFGMDAHDLIVLKKAPGAKPIVFKRRDPKGRTDRILKLTPGRYSLWCSIADHRSRGMRAALIVR